MLAEKPLVDASAAEINNVVLFVCASPHAICLSSVPGRRG
jgi:hypothetical protein